MQPQNDGKAPLLQIVKGSKVYGGLHAIDGVDFELRAGEIHALLGENGAGKSTLCKAIAGAITLTSGDYLINGSKAEFKSPQEALQAIVPTRHQDPPYQDPAKARLSGSARPRQGGKSGGSSFGILHGRHQRSCPAQTSRCTSAKRVAKHWHLNTQGRFSSHDRYFMALLARCRSRHSLAALANPPSFAI